MTFGDCVLAAAGNREFVLNIDRLRGTRFATMGQGGIGGMIDQATGYREHQCAEFCAIVYDLIWCRLPIETQTPPENRRRRVGYDRTPTAKDRATRKSNIARPATGGEP